MMKQTIIILFLIVFTGQSKAQDNALISVNDQHRIHVVGIGTVTVFPNAAQLTISLKFTKPKLRDAINENQTTAAEVIKILKKYVPDTNEIKVSLISTDKSMRWDNALKKDVFVGFESSQKIIFTLNDLTQMQNFTEEVLKT